MPRELRFRNAHFQTPFVLAIQVKQNLITEICANEPEKITWILRVRPHEWRGCGLGIFAWHFKRRGVPKWMQEIGPAFGVSVGIVAFIYWPGAKSKRIYRVKTWQEWKRGTFPQTCPPRYVQNCTLSKSGDSSIFSIYCYLCWSNILALLFGQKLFPDLLHCSNVMFIYLGQSGSRGGWTAITVV